MSARKSRKLAGVHFAHGDRGSAPADPYSCATVSSLEAAPESAGGRRAAPPSGLDMEGVTRFLRAAFPAATAAHVECATGIPAATADNWLRGRSSASGEHLGALATAFGPAFLSAAFPGVRARLKREVRDERIGKLLEEVAGLLAAE